MARNGKEERQGFKSQLNQIPFITIMAFFYDFFELRIQLKQFFWLSSEISQLVQFFVYLFIDRSDADEFLDSRQDHQTKKSSKEKKRSSLEINERSLSLSMSDFFLPLAERPRGLRYL